jgi:hypothetical protein
MTDMQETLQNEKMKHVQLLAFYYQQSLKMPPGDKRDEIIRRIYDCKKQIKIINEHLTEMKKSGTE